MIGESSMPNRRRSRRGQPGPARQVVVLENVEAVGLALAESLLEAGYHVVGRNVAAGCVQEFQAAGGLLAGVLTDTVDIAWLIECHERPGIHPETLSRLVSRRYGYGRPRLELSGSGRAAIGVNDDPVATLAIRSGRDAAATSELVVALDVSSRGLQLVVHGARPLFETALPVLTVLADRVLYSGMERDSSAHAPRRFPSRS